jgi:hippurate hydrolase
MKKRLIDDYKYLHQIPEESFKEYKTHKYIVEQLSPLSCQIFELLPTGVLAFFDYGYSDTIAFRCELDGLPIFEENNISYKSQHAGMMHACGHDGHMAILLSLAYRLETIKCPRNVCLIFQPSEESYGGALKVINSEEYKSLNIKEVYGLHLWPNLKKGVIASRGKTLMASSTEIDITITGKSCHIANKDEGVDAIKAASIFLNEVSNNEDIIFNCGKITSTGARNIVCDKVLLECSLRSFYKIRRKRFLTNIKELIKLLENTTQTKINLDCSKYIPELKNNLILFEKYRHLVDEVSAPVYQAEDFSFYGANAKILFFFLGAGNTSALHTNNFCFDVNVLEKGLKTFVKIAASR